MNISIVAHCDWSMNSKKRWMAVAVKAVDGWRVRPPELVGDTSTMFDRLRLLATERGSLLVGFDFPIGLPEAYARAADLGSFREALMQFGFGVWSDWYNVADHRDRISQYRPFYPARPGGTARADLFNALGVSGASALLRRCERVTADRQAACMLFWTLGGNQVGKGAISGWREIIVPRLEEIGLWPFDGSLVELAGTKAVIVAETYPGDVYHKLGIQRGGWSKRRQADRQRVGQSILSWLGARAGIDASAVLPHITEGFGSDGAGEDRFDAIVGLLGMLEVVDGRSDEGVPAIGEVRKWEGWILGHDRDDVT